uniref:Uncharacterized protein n=1 Tax=Candidatus Methanogaster sp. ANME-2c ERB4 TaxID=2759911 RepID=A0A7G9Y2S5_9EURY|nr:hypothetical protein CIDILJJO_00008 [Methanosarcinales archaeon ANME-2c ERB4]QNO42105.1 hypothetical protein INBEEEIC_00007 [Methanosarcinales archaeon ANME-2c ERB4]QNO42309.1 hypothetical protein OEDCDHIP_00026 [Methanosarcinales archaeon ANME-2c ERB4]QNO42471.1 hypothetical protein LBOOMNCC_00024 [Methanosarcinales archaeon ANME-2c ERB4]QNO42705.1 hypothetical protein AOABALHP_00008 [Methanosarcinales archaeon ANME-2c ERB4]
MTREYSRSKTVRFTPTSFLLVETAASGVGVTTSEFIREATLDALPGVKLCV